MQPGRGLNPGAMDLCPTALPDRPRERPVVVVVVVVVEVAIVVLDDSSADCRDSGR